MGGHANSSKLVSPRAQILSQLRSASGKHSASCFLSPPRSVRNRVHDATPNVACHHWRSYGETVQQSGFSPSQLHEARAVSGVIFQPLLGTPLWMPGWVRDRAGSITVWSSINMVVVWGRFEPATILWYSVDPPNWHRSGRLFNALLHSSVSTGQRRSSLGVPL